MDSILVIAEGKDDVNLMKRIFHEYDARIDTCGFVLYGTNIYTLYKKIVNNKNNDDFNIQSYLLSIENNPERKDILRRKYADICLIFDLEPHDTLFAPEKIRDMMSFFNSSGTRGKLYQLPHAGGLSSYEEHS